MSSLVKARDSAQSGAGNNGTGNTAATASDRNNQSAAGGNIANGNSQSATNGGRVIPRLSAGEGNGRQPNADTDSVDRRTGTNQSQGVDSDRRHAGIPGRSNVASSGIRQPAGSGVFNPYASAFSAASNPGARSAAVTTGGVGGECVGATPSRETLQRRSQEGEVRLSGSTVTRLRNSMLQSWRDTLIKLKFNTPIFYNSRDHPKQNYFGAWNM